LPAEHDVVVDYQKVFYKEQRAFEYQDTGGTRHSRRHATRRTQAPSPAVSEPAEPLSAAAAEDLIGRRVEKYFANGALAGWYQGQVIASFTTMSWQPMAKVFIVTVSTAVIWILFAFVRLSDASAVCSQGQDERWFKVRYEDGDEEECSLAELSKILKEEPSSAPAPAPGAAAAAAAAASSPVPVDYHSELHDGPGYAVILDFFGPSIEEYRAYIERRIKEDNSYVFQETPSSSTRPRDLSGDKRRLQGLLTGKEGKEILDAMSSKLEQEEVRIGGHNINTLVALQSLSECAPQPCHYDVDPALLTHCTPHTMPLLILVALDRGTTLQVWPKGQASSILLDLPQYSALVFRADLRHAGSAYRTQNL